MLLTSGAPRLGIGRARQPEVIAQRRSGVVVTEEPALLQDWHHVGDEPLEAFTAVRDWLDQEARLDADGPARLWDQFTDFMADNDDALIARGFSRRDIDRLPISTLMRSMEAWVAAHPL